jgi:PKHD-type hydroxylase
MENLYIPEIDFTVPTELNVQTFNFWSLKNDSLNEYTFIENIFTPEEIQEIIKIGLAHQQIESRTGDGRGFSEIRKSRNSWLPPSSITSWIYERIQRAIEEANKHFEFDLHSIENLQFTEYDSKYMGNYGKHIDKFQNATTPGSHRKLSFSVQLTDDNSYEGGDLIVYNGDNGVIANRSKGTINFFPSYATHEVTPVKKGTRYSLVSWCSGPKFR